MRWARIEHDGKPGYGIVHDDAVEIVRFLFRVGFILGVDTQARSTRYYQFEEKPELLKSRANLDDGLGWSIQPAFHAALGLAR